MAKALKIGASIAAIAAVTIVTGGAALGLGVALSTSAFGVSAGALLAASSVLGAGASLLAPKPKAPAGLSQSDRLTVSINVREPRKIVFGSTAMATDLRDQEWSSDQTYLHRFIVLASHKVSAVREIWFDDKLAWTAAGGAQGEFAKWLVVTPVLEGNAANAINIGPRMGGARRFTGCAYVHLRYQILANSKKLDSVFNQSVPSRVTIVGDGASVYDPRRDSTVPGGSGPQRANDQSTWEWNASASRNPALCTLFYLLGWRINGKLAVGKGIPPKRIDLASFIDAANLCDEPIAKAAGGTEPRYRCDGVISEADDTQAVLDNLKATMNAVLDDVDGRLRVSVLHNDLAAPIGDLFTGDVLGAFTWQQTLPLNDSVSVIRGGYSDPGSVSLYQTADYPEVTIASRDGIERSQTVNYPLVQSACQAQRLSKQRLQRMLYGGTFTAVFQSTAWKFQKGDVIRLTFAPLGWNRKLFRIADMATQVDGKVPMMLREEHPAIYAWDASDAAPITGAEPTRYDPALWPLLQGITEAGTTADWDKVADPNNTKPEDNATVGAPSGTEIGGRPVDDVVAAIDAAKARQDEFETETLPAIDKAVADAAKRVDDAAKTITNFDQRVTTVESSSANGGNLLSNTDMLVDASGWVFSSEAFSRGYLASWGPDIYWPDGMKALQIYSPTAAPDRAGFWYQAVRGIEGGGTYQASLYVGSHRATAGIYIDEFRADGAIVGHSEKATGKFNTGTRNLAADYERVFVNFTAHPDTAYLIFYIMKYGTLDAQPDSYSWFLRPQLAKVRKGVTELVPYTPGSADAGAAALNARVSTVEKAGNDGRLALATRATTLEAAAMSPRSTTLNANPDFSYWPDANGNKAPGWEWWNAAIGDAQRVPAEGRRSGWAYRHDVPAGTDMGWWQTPILIDAGWWVFEADTILRGGSYYGVGITVDGIYNFDFAREADTNGVAGPYGINQRRRWSKLIKINEAHNNFHLMQNWAGFAPMEAKQIDWYYCGIRPATDAEIAARRAIDVTIPAVSARVEVTEDALADLPNHYATAKQATDLEAQVNGTADSNLLARANQQAVVIADGAVGAVAERVDGLETDYGGRIASVEEKAATISGIDGRTAIYWGVTGSTPNGKTGIGLYLKDGSPGDFIVNANMLVDGNILATGSIRSLAFDSDTMGRTGSASWAGLVEGVVGGANIPFSLTLTPIYPRGRFLIEAAIAITSDAGQTTITNNYQGTGKQLRVTRVAAGGGLFLRSYDDQGNVYQVSNAPFQSLPVLATTTFGTTFVATISKANYDTGVTDQGDFFQRLIAASYTVTSISMKATWIAT